MENRPTTFDVSTYTSSNNLPMFRDMSHGAVSRASVNREASAIAFEKVAAPSDTVVHDGLLHVSHITLVLLSN